MKKTISILMLAVSALAFTSCNKEVYGCDDKTATNYDSKVTSRDGSCKYEGSVVFYQKSDNGVIGVSISGKSGTITKYYPAGVPDCNGSGCFTATLPTGVYKWAAAAGTETTDGEVTITANNCTKVLLD